jgi:uncharacterized lipoprotein YbaY
MLGEEHEKSISKITLPDNALTSRRIQDMSQDAESQVIASTKEA